MSFFANISIRQKLVMVMLSITAIALLLTSIASATYEWHSLRRSIVRDLNAQAEIIGANCSVALAFRDPKTAREILSALHARPKIVYTCLFDRHGHLFAEYTPSSTGKPTALLTAEPDGYRFEPDHLMLFREISLGADKVGTICLRASLNEQTARLYNYAGILASLMIAALVVALFLSAWLQRIISGPILSLARVTRSVTEQKDFSLRAPCHSSDEIGQLTDGFNDMLTQIQARDLALRESEERFRQLTETIHEVFWMTDVAYTQMLYVSPSYAQIWGRSCESLYAAPHSWVDAIHLQDRDRVIQSFLSKGALGTYEEEYRIARPDGSMRWIRDRAFPVRDDKGKVIRLAGIAEDITRYKQAEDALRLQSQIADNLEEGVLLTRASDATIVYANPKFERMFGYTAGELNGNPMSIVNAHLEKAPDEIARSITSSLRTTGTWSGEICNRRKDGTSFWCFANISTFEHAHHGTVWISVQTDVTERKRLEKQILEISDREQQRIGQDLHDGLCQHLVATEYAASVLEQKLSEKTFKESIDAGEIATLINEAVNQARTLARILYPVRLQFDGLASALQELSYSTENLWGITCRFEGDASVSIDDIPAATHLYRIAQEAVANAVKHSQAKEIAVRLGTLNDTVTLTVSDNGKGIPDATPPPKGMGMHIMQYRARMIGGSLHILSTPGVGTTVTCTWPNSAQAHLHRASDSTLGSESVIRMQEIQS